MWLSKHDLSTDALQPPPPPLPRYYWWRAQAAAYVLRFPTNVEALLRQRQAAIYPNYPGAQPTLPRGTISLHIRRGDKISEAALCSDFEFVKTRSKRHGGAF